MFKVDTEKRKNKEFIKEKSDVKIIAFRDLLDTDLQLIHDAHGGFSSELALMQILKELKKIKDK